MRNRKEKIRKLKCQSRGSHNQIINSKKSKQNKKERKTQQNNSRTFPRAEGHEIPRWKHPAWWMKMDKHKDTLSWNFRTLGTKKNSTNVQREKIAIMVLDNLLTIHSSSRSYWTGCSTETRVNQEKQRLRMQKTGKLAGEEGASCARGAQGRWSSVQSSPRRWINRYLMCLNIRRKFSLLGLK